MLSFQLPKLNRSRALITGVAILALIVVIALAAVNAAATPRSMAEIRIAGWVGALKNDKLTAERQEAQRNLELAGETAVPQLLVALRSNNVAQRRNAADMLGYIASPLTTDALRNTLRTDPVPAVRRNAAYALGEIHAASAINDLQQAAISDRSQIVRGTAADSLARIRTILAQSAHVNEQFVGAFASASSQSNLVYLAAKRDLKISQDGGKTWQTLANALPSQVSALAVNPNDAQELYAGIEALGMFKSTDGGTTWNAINTGISMTPGARETISAIAIDPNDTNILYVARGVWVGTGQVEFYPVGLFWSRDGGNSWNALSAGTSTQEISKLAFRDGKLFGLAGDRVLTLVTPQ
ncbi:MAG: hypothetical protein EYC68_06350 [Chloroflexota bacterium]|nr:MAG: hypothetical protein EYC68_06350 [Chloroflexota bacterium]